MKQMISPFESVISLSTALRRSSNSPRNLVPATIEPRFDRDQSLVAQLVGNVAFDDALRQTLDNGRLADARLADQHRIVLGSAAQHLHHAANLFIAPDHRIELAAPRLLGQIDGIALQRLIFRFRILIGNPLRAAHRDQRLQNRIVGRALLDSGGCPAGSYFCSAMASSRCSVETYSSLKFSASLNARFEYLVQGGRDVHARARARSGDLGDRLRAGARPRATMAIRLHAALFQHGPHDALALAGQRNQQMQRVTAWCPFFSAGDFLRLLNRFLRFLRQFVKSKQWVPAFWKHKPGRKPFGRPGMHSPVRCLKVTV